MISPDDVLDFWFGAPGSDEHGKARSLWFTKSDATDALIRQRFGTAVEPALRGDYDAWATSDTGAVALIVLLDQFTRNIFRDTQRAFAGDSKALALAQALVASGAHLRLAPYQRWFAYMPFEHAENLQAQREAVRLFDELAASTGIDTGDWAQRHHDVIARFGRFPHRNAILGRPSTPEEIKFLEQPGSRF